MSDAEEKATLRSQIKRHLSGFASDAVFHGYQGQLWHDNVWQR